MERPLRVSTGISSPNPPPPLRQPRYGKPGDKPLRPGTSFLSPVRANPTTVSGVMLTLDITRCKIFLSQRHLCGTTRIAHRYHHWESDGCFPPTSKDWGDIYFPVFFFCKKNTDISLNHQISIWPISLGTLERDIREVGLNFYSPQRRPGNSSQDATSRYIEVNENEYPRMYLRKEGCSSIQTDQEVPLCLYKIMVLPIRKLFKPKEICGPNETHNF